MAKKKEVYLSKAQIQRLCELYQEEEHLWNIQSPHYFKKDKKQAALIRIKEALENDHEDLPTCTGIILILFWYHPFNKQKKNSYFLNTYDNC